MSSEDYLDLTEPQFKRLNQDQCVQMHEACLEILDGTGVRLFEPEAIDLLKRAGCKVSDDNIVRIPPPLVEWAISTAPQKVTIYNQSGEATMPIGGYESFFGPGSDCLNIIDHRTSIRRPPTLHDVIEAVTVCDVLGNIDFVMSIFWPYDVNQKFADRFQMKAMLENTSKPIVFVSYDIAGCVDAVNMAEAVAGGPDNLREKPFVACYDNVTTGLQHNKDALKKLLFMAEKGLPVFYIPGAMAGAAGPVTVAGSNAIRIAGALAGVVIAQLKREGAPVFIPGWAALAMDMNSTIQIYTGPDHQGVSQAMSHYLKLPMFAMGGASDSKLVDQQAGIEAALTLMINALAGSQIVHDVGYMESGLSGSIAQLVICDEILTWIKRCLRPITIDKETLALDLIDEVGPDGQFLDTDHTYRHFREQWHPSLFDRNNFEGWVMKGSKSLAVRAADRVEEILSTHKPNAPPKDTIKAIEAIIEKTTAGNNQNTN